MMSAVWHDALIAGGGIAGSAAAITLAQAGYSCIVIEKSEYPHHKVCGEFLSPECIPLLQPAWRSTRITWPTDDPFAPSRSTQCPCGDSSARSSAFNYAANP